MSEPIITTLPKSLVELKFTVTPDEAKPYLDQAAVDLQAPKPIQGFRPGKAPYDEVKKAFGEMRIWETALERIVRAKFVHAILEKGIESIGSPEIAVDQLTPGNDIRFTVTVPVMPSVLMLADYDKPLVTKKMTAVADADVDAAIEDLRKMRRLEAVVDRVSTNEDLVLIDLEIRKDGVVLEGGTAKNHRVYLNEPHYIPGFAEKLIGAKKGDANTFDLAFPKEHYQKHLAGQTVTFITTVNDVYELQLPALDDVFAKGLGAESLAALRELLRTNLHNEASQKADEAAEIELLQKLVGGSKFSEVPDLLVTEEVRRMMAELQHGAEHQGMKFEDYLSQLKKSADDLRLGMVPDALNRVRTAVLIKEVAKKESVSVDEKDLDTELDRILTSVQDKETKERVASPEYREYLAAQMKNRKTLHLLKQKAITESK